MDQRLAQSAHTLRAGAHLALRGARGWTVVSEHAPAWLTLEGHSQDKQLRPGERFTVPGEGLMLVEVLGASCLRLEPPPPGMLARLALGGRGLVQAAARTSLYAAERMGLRPAT